MQGVRQPGRVHGATGREESLGEHLAADVRRWSDVIAKAKIARQ